MFAVKVRRGPQGDPRSCFFAPNARAAVVGL